MPSPVVRRGDWKTVPPAGPFARLPYSDSFSQTEFEALQRGLLPSAMEDKWFVFYEAPTLFLHRSWTGELIYRQTLEPRADRAVVTAADVSAKYEADSMQAKLLPWVIRGVLLGQDVPFPDV